MSVATFAKVISSLPAEVGSCSAFRQLPASAIVVLSLLLFNPVMNLSAGAIAVAQSQMQLNQEACDAYKQADAEMNAAYRRITRDYPQQPAFIGALRKAQLAWIRYRDAHLESIFPGDASQYGSISPMCRCMSLTEITKERTKALNRWVEGIEEGDVCAGSVKVK